jgi:hypothetical protein
MTLETKPQRKNQRTVLCHMTGLQPGGHTVRAPGRSGHRAMCQGYQCVGYGKLGWLSKDMQYHSPTHGLTH